MKKCRALLSPMCQHRRPSVALLFEKEWEPCPHRAVAWSPAEDTLLVSAELGMATLLPLGSSWSDCRMGTSGQTLRISVTLAVPPRAVRVQKAIEQYWCCHHLQMVWGVG